MFELLRCAGGNSHEDMGNVGGSKCWAQALVMFYVEPRGLGVPILSHSHIG